MAGKDIISMSQRELKRLHIIHRVLDRRLKQINAARILELSARQIRRIALIVKQEGDKGIVHKSRGRPSNRALSPRIKQKAITLYRKKYHDFGPTLANEKLFEIDKIKIGTQTLRNWLIEEDIWRIKRKVRKHRQWRERKHHFGEMIQTDGSHHDWFEGRGPACVLMGHIDDATNNALARFYEYEGTMPAMDCFKRYVKKYGLPLSVYLDRHTTYKSPAKPSAEDELSNTKPLSHFEKAMRKLGVDVIHALSAPAKGRIERLFKTFQDRLIKEMRLRQISTIEEANEFLSKYLPVYNRRFSIEPIEKGDSHRPLPKGIDLNRILCIETKRALRNDFTVAHNKRLYQVKDRVNARNVMVEERLNGRMFIIHKGNPLKYEEINQRPKKKKEHSCKLLKPRKRYVPPKGHIYRNFTLPGSINFIKKQKAEKLTA